MSTLFYEEELASSRAAADAMEAINARIRQGWQCPECYGVRIDCFESRFGGRSEDRFECNECGATWHRK